MAYRESMKDPSTTIRTGRHKRQSPVKRDVGDSEHDYSQSTGIQAMLEQYPILAEYAKQIALARLATYNQDDWGTKMGWGEMFNYPENPYPDMFDPESLEEMSAPAMTLFETDSPEYYRRMREFNDWYAHRNEPVLNLKPMTEDDAKKQGIHWSPSTDEYIRALVANGVVRNEDDMRKMAQAQLYNILMEDLRSGKPKYEMALRKLIGEKDEPYAPADTTELYRKQHPSWGEDKVFESQNAMANLVLNGFIPFTNRVLADPELRHKASVGQIAGRALGDIGMMGLYALGPEALATRGALMLAGKGASSGVGGLLARGGVRAGAGATTGALGWGAKNFVADPMAYRLSGVGTQQGPADVRDLALESTLGAVGNTLSTGLLRGAMKPERAFRIPETMAPDKPSAVTYGDIKASFNAMKPKDVVSGSSPKARSLFEDTDLAKYKKKYPDEEIKVESNPPMIVNLNPKEGGPIQMGAFSGLPKTGQKAIIKKMTQTPGHRYYGFKEARDPDMAKVWGRSTPIYEELIPSHKLLQDKTKVPVGSYLKDMVPTGYKREVMVEDPSENIFYNRYMEQNKDFFSPYTKEEKEALRKEMKNAQIRASDASKRFSGKDEYMSGGDWASEYRASKGDALGDDKANLGNLSRSAQLTKKSTPGVRDKKTGDWSTSEKQQKDFGKAKKTIQKRSQMKVVGEDFLKKQNDVQLFGNNSTVRRLGGLALRTAGAPFITNNANIASDIIPYSVNFLGPRAEQIEYYDKE